MFWTGNPYWRGLAAKKLNNMNQQLIEAFVLGFRISEAKYNKGVVASHAEIMEEARAVEGLKPKHPFAQALLMDRDADIQSAKNSMSESLLNGDWNSPDINDVLDLG